MDIVPEKLVKKSKNLEGRYFSGKIVSKMFRLVTLLRSLVPK